MVYSIEFGARASLVLFTREYPLSNVTNKYLSNNRYLYADLRIFKQSCCIFAISCFVSELVVPNYSQCKTDCKKVLICTWVQFDRFRRFVHALDCLQWFLAPK